MMKLFIGDENYEDHDDKAKHSGAAVFHRDEWRPGRVGEQQP